MEDANDVKIILKDHQMEDNVLQTIANQIRFLIVMELVGYARHSNTLDRMVDLA